ncbi:MAG: phenol/toluene 2-monooxygenase, partial [Thermoanaerobaculia bacterium]|nr:phenol/toluene 2-monooxygenase [Thermoanaerobaculia bacterium]
MRAHKASVTEIEELAPSVVQITVAFDDESFSFLPGQWVNFRFPDGVSRAYTIASAPQRPQAVQLCVRVGEGRGGKALMKLDAGAAVTIDGPYGDFVLPENDGRPILFMAGDTGIAPIRSMVLSMLADRDPRKIAVLYEPDQRNILYSADFDPLARDETESHASRPYSGFADDPRPADILTSMRAHKASVTEIEELAPSVVQITVAFDDESFSFQAGQWVNFRFPDGVSRAYTIASAAQRPQAVQLCVRVGAGRG